MVWVGLHGPGHSFIVLEFQIVFGLGVMTQLIHLFILDRHFAMPFQMPCLPCVLWLPQLTIKTIHPIAISWCLSDFRIALPWPLFNNIGCWISQSRTSLTTLLSSNAST